MSGHESKKRFKLLVWAKSARATKANATATTNAAEGGMSEEKPKETNTKLDEQSLGREGKSEWEALHEEFDAEMERVWSSLNDMARERDLLAQQTALGHQTLQSSYAALARHSCCFRNVASKRCVRRGSVWWLRLCLNLTLRGAHEDGEHPAQEDIQIMCAAEALAAHARLAKLFVSFQSVDWDLAASHLCSARALEETSENLFDFLSPADTADTHLCLGIAYRECARKHDMGAHRQVCLKRSEGHLRDAISLGSSLSMCAQAEIHEALAALYKNFAGTFTFLRSFSQHILFLEPFDTIVECRHFK